MSWKVFPNVVKEMDCLPKRKMPGNLSSDSAPCILEEREPYAWLNLS